MNDPVEEHIQAYNARALDRFVACYSPDCVMEDARDTVLARGHADFRAHFGRVFADNPELHCEILHRVRVGHYVVDEEHVAGRHRRGAARRGREPRQRWCDRPSAHHPLTPLGRQMGSMGPILSRPPDDPSSGATRSPGIARRSKSATCQHGTEE